MWLRNLSHMQPTVSRFRSLPISGETKREERQERIWQLGARDPSGGAQLTAKVKPLIGVKETMLAMHVRLLPFPLFCQHPMALL